MNRICYNDDGALFSPNLCRLFRPPLKSRSWEFRHLEKRAKIYLLNRQWLSRTLPNYVQIRRTSAVWVPKAENFENQLLVKSRMADGPQIFNL